MFLKLFRRNTNCDSCEKHVTGTGITGIRRIPAGKCNLASTEESEMGLEKDENNSVASGGNEEGKTTAEQSPARNTRARKKLF